MVPSVSNRIVLSALGSSEGPVTLGLLPLSNPEQQSCIQEVTDYCNGNIERLIDLLGILSPAAASYAIAACASQAVTSGQAFYEPFSKKLGIPLPAERQYDRQRLSKTFVNACRRLGVVIPDVGDMYHHLIAPIMAQSSILHAWAEALANGLRVTLNDYPLPDLEDYQALRQFAGALSERIHNQRQLQQVLETEAGPIVVHRLIASCVHNRYEMLPPHLREQIRAAFESRGGGRQTVLKSAYASFSESLGAFELVLPKQPARLVSDSTYWLVNEKYQYSPVTENRLTQFELGTGKISVALKHLAGGYSDQKFTVSLGLDEQPIRIFEHDSLRERTFKLGQRNELSPGRYLLVLQPEIQTSESGMESQVNGYKLLSGLEMRPGLSALEIFQGNQTTTSLDVILKTGITCIEGEYVPTRDGARIYYGSAPALSAWFPQKDGNKQYGIRIESRNKILLESECNLPANDGNTYHCVGIGSVVAIALAQITAGIHPIQVQITTRTESTVHEIWFWKELVSASNYSGFHCLSFPGNLDIGESRGVQRSGTDLKFLENFLTPEVCLALKEGERLKICRPGVSSICIDPTDQWSSVLTPTDCLAVGAKDSRIVRFESGGLESWKLICNGKEFLNLTRNKTDSCISIGSLLAQFGNVGAIEAESSTGIRQKLFHYSADLLALGVNPEEDQTSSTNAWVCVVPQEAGSIGARIVNYSVSPVGELSEITLLFDHENPEDRKIALREGIAASVTLMPAADPQPAMARIVLEINPSQASQEFIFVEVMRKPIGADDWEKLQCVDGPTTSQVITLSMGSGPARDGCWWNHLWRVSSKKFDEKDKPLYSGASGPELEAALDTISKVNEIKYPSAVYKQSAWYLNSLSHRLSERREGMDHDDCSWWWRASAKELYRHSHAPVTPVVRQFLFANNSRQLWQCWEKEPLETELFPGPLVRSLSILGQIRNSGGRLPYAAQSFLTKRHRIELFTCFSNFSQCSNGKATDFTAFDFNLFFQLTSKQAADAADLELSVADAQLLSGEHLMGAINNLGRRARVLARAANSAAGHALSAPLQGVSSTHAKLEPYIHAINATIGYSPKGDTSWTKFQSQESEDYPPLPLIANRQARQLADLTWALCVLTRGKAHGFVSKEQLATYFPLFTPQKDLPPGVTMVQAHPVNLVLSFAPELFAYYTGLLDFVLYRPNSIS
jgi:hypothetical protein